MFTKPIRGWIKFAQIFGTIISVTGLIAWIVLLGDSGDNILKGLGTGADSSIYAWYGLVLGLLSYFAVKSIICAVLIIQAMDKMSDLELSANRWMISALSLTVGGFFTPFIMAMFPNVNIRSTMNPKVFISKALGITLAIGAPVFIVCYAAFVGSKSFDGTVATSVSAVVYTLYGLLTILGISMSAFFMRNNANEIYNGDTSKSKFMHFSANLINVAVTGELVIMLVYNWIEFIAQIWYSIADTRNSNGSVNILGIIFAIFNIWLSILYIGFITQLTCQTIKGIWTNEPSYTAFEPLRNYKRNNNSLESM